jgi:hypothetical protein
MSTRDVVMSMLESRPREDGGTLETEPDVAQLRAAIVELQNAIVELAEVIDERE